MKGVILAGGQGSRLYPLTHTTSKQLLAVYDKPMIYYPLSILMLSGIQEMMIITTPSDYSLYEALLGDGSQFGCRFSYGVQPKPRGLPEAFLIAEKFIGKERVALILGDNIFYGAGLGGILRQVAQKQGHSVWAYRMEHPESYGVVALDENNKPISIEEKPTRPRSPYVLVGLYFYESEVVAQAKTLRPSARGEWEISDINAYFMKRGTLNVEILPRGTMWVDAGTPDRLLDASQFVQIVEKRQGLKVGCLEEVAYRLGYINREKLENLIKTYGNNHYSRYLKQLL